MDASRGFRFIFYSLRLYLRMRRWARLLITLLLLVSTLNETIKQIFNNLFVDDNLLSLLL